MRGGIREVVGRFSGGPLAPSVDSPESEGYTLLFRGTPADMVVIDASDQEEIKTILKQEGRIRKSELEERVDPIAHIDHHLVTLVEDGDAAIFPVGDVVIIRSE
jgi:hypothetical protein